LDRRAFIRSAAAAVAVPSLLAGLAIPNRAFAAGRVRSDTLKVGLIGCGGRGTGAAVQALRADPGTVLTSMGDLFADRLESSLKGITEELAESAPARVQVAPEHKFVGFDAYQKVIDSGVDVVLLCTVPHFRPIHLKAAIEAGKHVFAEKPLAVDAPGIRSVLASAHLAKQKNLALQVGFCWRYAEAEKATFERINQGAVGDIVTVHSTYHTGTLSARPRQPQWSEMEFQLRNWWHFAWVSGDHIVEQAVHSIDRLAWALGDRLPLRCNALGGRAARTGEESGHAFDHFAVVYEYEGGRRCFHTCRQIDGCPSDNTDYIYGTKGSCTVNGWTPLHTIKDLAGKELWKYEGPKRDMYQNEHDALFASIRAGTPINDCERGANSTLMAIMGRMAAYTGQTITWEQAMNSQEDLSPARYEFSDLPKPPVAVPGKTKFV